MPSLSQSLVVLWTRSLFIPLSDTWQSALQRQTCLPRMLVRDAVWRGIDSLDLIISREVARHPFQYIRPQPTDLAAAKSLFLGEAAQQHQTRKDQPRAAREPGHVVSAEKLLKWRERFIDPG